MQSTFEEEKIIKMSKCTFYGRPVAHPDSWYDFGPISTSGFLHIDAICWALPKKGLCRSMFDCNRCVLHEGEWPLSCVCSLVTDRDLRGCPLGTILLIRLLSQQSQVITFPPPPISGKKTLDLLLKGLLTHTADFFVKDLSYNSALNFST